MRDDFSDLFIECEQFIEKAEISWFDQCVLLILAIACLVLGLASILFIVFGVLFLAFAILNKRSKLLIVTTKRIMLQKGLMARNTIDMPLNKIESIHIAHQYQTLLSTFGTLKVNGTGGHSLRFKFVREPAEFKRLILQLIDASQKSHADAEATYERIRSEGQTIEIASKGAKSKIFSCILIACIYIVLVFAIQSNSEKSEDKTSSVSQNSDTQSLTAPNLQTAKTNSCGLPYPCSLAPLINKADWHYILSALVFSMQDAITTRINWASKSLGHKGYVQQETDQIASPGCKVFEVTRYKGSKSNSVEVTACQNPDHTMNVSDEDSTSNNLAIPRSSDDGPQDSNGDTASSLQYKSEAVTKNIEDDRKISPDTKPSTSQPIQAHDTTNLLATAFPIYNVRTFCKGQPIGCGHEQQISYDKARLYWGLVRNSDRYLCVKENENAGPVINGIKTPLEYTYLAMCLEGKKLYIDRDAELKEMRQPFHY